MSIAASCVGTTKTKAMTDAAMPFIMGLMGRFGVPAEISAANAVRLLTRSSANDANGAVLRKPKLYRPEPLALDQAEAQELWLLTARLAEQRGLHLP